MTTTGNPYEALAREIKAAELASVLRGRNVDADTAAAFDDEGRRRTALVARTHPASDVVWHRVVEMLRTDENYRALAELADATLG